VVFDSFTPAIQIAPAPKIKMATSGMRGSEWNMPPRRAERSRRCLLREFLFEKGYTGRRSSEVRQKQPFGSLATTLGTNVTRSIAARTLRARPIEGSRAAILPVGSPPENRAKPQVRTHPISGNQPAVPE
jgi:hypothetical protein